MVEARTKLAGIRVIVFDLDDTLIDNKKLDFESFKHLSYGLGLYMPTMHEIIELRCRSLRAKDIISWMIERSKKSVSRTFCMEERKKFLKLEGAGRLIRIKPKSRSTLQELKSRGYLLILATVRDDKNAVLDLLRKRKLAEFFTSVYTNPSRILDETTKISNPDVETVKFKIYREILCDLKVFSNECLVVGDTLQDLSPALSLGMKAIGTKGSYRTDPAMIGTVEIVENLSDLVKLL